MNLLTFLPRVPSSNLTHAFVPRDFLRGLFGALDTDLREPFTKLDTKLDSLPLEDTFPSNIDPSTISLVCVFLLTSLALFTPDAHYSWRAERWHRR